MGEVESPMTEVEDVPDAEYWCILAFYDELAYARELYVTEEERQSVFTDLLKDMLERNIPFWYTVLPEKEEEEKGEKRG
jgi:hypothetical protein